MITPQIQTISLLGSSSGRNAGDAALLAGIMDSIDSACGEQLNYEIPTIKPSFVRKSYSNRVLPISMLPWHGAVKIFGIPTYRSIMRSDLSLVFDAVLFDRSLYNPLFNHLSTLYLFLRAAKKRGKKMGFFSVTAGPVTTPAGKKMLRELSDIMDFITVRDEGSARVLYDIGVSNPNIIVTADAALIVKPSPKERIDQIYRSIGMDSEEPILAVNINKYLNTWADGVSKPLSRREFVSIYGEALTNVLKEIDANVLFIATQHHDVDITRELMAAVTCKKKKCLISNVQYGHSDLKGVLSRVSLLTSMRLHCSILATGAFTPTVALAFLPKVTHYFESLGLSEYCADLGGVSASKIASHILRGWHERKALKAQLGIAIPELQKRALVSGKIVAAMRRGENISDYCSAHAAVNG